MDFDVAIIGAGVIGCAIARNLGRYNLQVAVLEKGAGPSAGTSKANSGIIHGGYDPRPGTLMAKYGLAGAEIMPKLAQELGVTYVECGSLVVARSPEELGELKRLLAQGLENGVVDLEIISRDEALRLEPELTPLVVDALYAPKAGVIAPYELTHSLANSAAVNGVQFFFNCEVSAITRRDGKFKLTTNRGHYLSQVVVNAAGVHADDIAAMIGDFSFVISPIKGEEAILDKRVGGLVRRVIFPVPSDISKGIVVTPTADGNLLIGPTAVDVEDKICHETTADGQSNILSGARELIPSISARDVITAYAGLRAAANTGDFVIGPSPANPAFINVAGIKSPGLTAAPAIAEDVTRLVVEQLRAELKAEFVVHPPLPKVAELVFLEWQELIDRDPRFGHVVCRCETVTEGEVCRAMSSPLPATTLDDLKQRTRAGMGRCGGGFCTPSLIEIMQRELGLKPEQVTKKGPGSWIIAGELR